jgi:hypothetical protein
MVLKRRSNRHALAKTNKDENNHINFFTISNVMLISNANE